MVDWQTISAFATACGTLVLAAATFTAVRSSNRSARIAEQALLTGLRPLLVTSRADDPDHKVVWYDHKALLSGGRAIAEHDGGVIYFAIGLRNVGTGLALLHGWSPAPKWLHADDPHADIDAFRRLAIDLYVPPNGSGYWESALRVEDDPLYGEFRRVLVEHQPFTIDLLYGDQDGGQRTISRCLVLPAKEDGWYGQIARHWHLDRAAPR